MPNSWAKIFFKAVAVDMGNHLSLYLNNRLSLTKTVFSFFTHEAHIFITKILFTSFDGGLGCV